MASLKDRVSRLRERQPWLDHVFRTVAHYGAVGGNAQAGAVTFFGFLSFFPILALAFFVVGLLAQVYPDLRNDLRTAINGLLPGLIGPGDGQIAMKTFEDAGGAVGVVGLAGVLYSGLGWLSGMRSALEVMFAVPRREQPGFVRGKMLDLGTLVAIGTTLLLSVSLSAAVAGFSSAILGWVGIDAATPAPQALLSVVGHALAIAATAVLFASMFRLLVDPDLPKPSLWKGALLGAVGFELLKMLANFLLAQTKDQPAAQAFGVALILLVWINYFSRLVMYAAAYAYTSPRALQRRAAEATRGSGAAQSAEPDDAAEVGTSAPDRAPAGVPAEGRRRWLAVGGTALGVALAGAVAARQRRD